MGVKPHAARDVPERDEGHPGHQAAGAKVAGAAVACRRRWDGVSTQDLVVWGGALGDPHAAHQSSQTGRRATPCAVLRPCRPPQAAAAAAWSSTLRGATRTQPPERQPAGSPRRHQRGARSGGATAEGGRDSCAGWEGANVVAHCQGHLTTDCAPPPRAPRPALRLLRVAQRLPRTPTPAWCRTGRGRRAAATWCCRCQSPRAAQTTAESRTPRLPRRRCRG